MEKANVKELVDLIVIHRPYFKTRLGDSIYQELLNEWTRIMGPYDFEDIKTNLERFLKDENNYGKDPDAYQLIRGLLTTEDKKINKQGIVYCQFCHRAFNRLEVYEHENRCRSIRHLERLYKNLLKRQLINKKEMYDMPEKEFDEKYFNTLEKLLPYMKNEVDRKGTINAIETHYGREEKFTLDEVIGKA